MITIQTMVNKVYKNILEVMKDEEEINKEVNDIIIDYKQRVRLSYLQTLGVKSKIREIKRRKREEALT